MDHHIYLNPIVASVWLVNKSPEDILNLPLPFSEEGTQEEESVTLL